MVDLFIIGNGFDLAHGLKTDTNSFILWLLEESFAQLKKNQFSSTGNKILSFGSGYNWSKFDINSILDYNITYGNSFFKRMFSERTNNSWEGVERSYFSSLVSAKDLAQVSKLNKEFSDVREEFIKYINHINNNIPKEITKGAILDHFGNILETTSKSIDKYAYKLIFLNFNYTSTLDQYISELENNSYFSDHSIAPIHIHGSVNNPDSIIFGYGDESDPKYLQIEQENNNGYLKYFKSFMYLERDNYSNLINNLTGTEYRVHIMGHSCGLSDRVLLKEIFCKKECKEIIIYYYKNEETNQNDFTDKVMNISRVFPLEDKSSLRIKIRSFKKCRPLS
ncbi:MAG: hypothetical protein CVU13_01085 [Bacteroidetes bacterium HGW-Bacteroidetes-8]|jgi:hypothetical protein|nr:MAG: hypothetical protein CVU13_01085 [Bacteroidetes bacterium HGW-Bacteroidetes-8]